MYLVRKTTFPHRVSSICKEIQRACHLHAGLSAALPGSGNVDDKRFLASYAGAQEAEAAAAVVEEQLRASLADAVARVLELGAAAGAASGAEERVAALQAQHDAMQR